MLVRPVMKRLFFLGKPRKKRLASLARLIIIPILYEGYIVSVHIMVIENRPVDPGSI